MSRRGQRLFWAVLTALSVVLIHLQILLFSWNPLLLDRVEPGVELVTVEPGESLGTIAGRLEKKGIVPSAWWLKLYVRLSGQERAIQAGEYRLRSQSPVELVKRMIAGDVHLHRITIIEGWKFADLRKALRSHQALKHTIVGKSRTHIADKLAIGEAYLDGAFLPDTYFFARGAEDLSILLRSHQAANRLFHALWPDRDVEVDPFLDGQWQVFTLASMVEKESVLDAEKARIAGVFFGRLKRGMRLQSDPTVIYALGDRYDGNIREKDLRIKHPVNTYRVGGIPPQPIAFPGKKSIAAVLHPDIRGELYFVAAGDGSHVFSRTLREHNKAVHRYILKMRSLRSK